MNFLSSCEYSSVVPSGENEELWPAQKNEFEDLQPKLGSGWCLSLYLRNKEVQSLKL